MNSQLILLLPRVSQDGEVYSEFDELIVLAEDEDVYAPDSISKDERAMTSGMNIYINERYLVTLYTALNHHYLNLINM